MVSIDIQYEPCDAGPDLKWGSVAYIQKGLLIIDGLVLSYLEPKHEDRDKRFLHYENKNNTVDEFRFGLTFVC